MEVTLPTQWFVVVSRDGARMRMRLTPTRDGGERLAAVNGGLGIVPVERLGAGDHLALTEAYHVFRRLELPVAATGNEKLASAFAIWRDALARSGIELDLERRALHGMPLPQTDWRGSTSGVSARPWDMELTALTAALRTVVKLDGVPLDFVDSLRGLVEQRGVRTEVVTPKRANTGSTADPVTILAARDAATLVEARELEALLLASKGAPDATAATIRMGELLGYPRCCADRFTRIAAHNDTTLAWALLPGAPHPPASPVTQWLNPALALLSHAPCDLQCPGSIALGARLLEEIERADPSFAAGWRALTGRVHVIDHRGNRLTLAVEGSLEAGATITGVDVVASGRSDPGVMTSAQRLIGRTVQAQCGGITTMDGSWYAPYVADHRGAS